MEEKFYTIERAQQILIALLKEHGIKKIVASPGTTNLTFVASLQHDSFFEIYSSVDERSAAYMACGLAAESGESVVITCTGATASRNYMPGLTEAFYRKLPILAITANSGVQNKSHLIAQQIDRSRLPVDIAKFSVDIPVVKDETDAWMCNVNVNKAILYLTKDGGGPVHINLATTYSSDYSVRELPKQRVIERINEGDAFPKIDGKKIGIFIGSHKNFSDTETHAIDEFCKKHDAAVFCDHTSGYYGKYKVNYSLVCFQKQYSETRTIDILIHLGEVSGDYYGMGMSPKEIWRVSLDGEIRDTFHRLRYIFQMPEHVFFNRYTTEYHIASSEYYNQCRKEYNEVRLNIPELPFGNIWIAQQLSDKLPGSSVVHLGILNTLRSWNFFELTDGVQSYCNVGGFGIDGIMSTAIGASLTDSNKIYFCILGDLAFMYDLNSLANRHVGSNIRILLINNGRGTEFTNYGHLGHAFGKDADPFIAAAGHFGNQSHVLVKHFAEDLGFEYITASNKVEFNNVYMKFISPQKLERPIIFEVFTDSKNESEALEMMSNINVPPVTVKDAVKKIIIDTLGEQNIITLRNKLGI